MGSWISAVALLDICSMMKTFLLEKTYGERRKNWNQIQEKKKTNAISHSRSSGVYDRSGIFLSSTLKYCDLYKFSPSATVSPCSRVNVAMRKTPQLAVEQLRNCIIFLPLFKTDYLDRVLYALFWILQSLIRSLLWKYLNLPGAHVNPYPVKDGLRLLWVFKNSILMTTHPKPGCIFLTVIRSYIKSRRAAITDPEQPAAGAEFQLRLWEGVSGFRSTGASSLQRLIH